MRVRVLFFAKAREVANTGEIELEVAEGSDTSALLDAVTELYPGIKGVMDTIVLALNMEYLAKGQSEALKEGDEVAFIPPISGG